MLKLFGEMESRPTILNRARWRKGSTPDADHISPAQIKSDRENLGKQIAVVTEFANRSLAHRTPEWQAPPTTTDDLDQPLEGVCGVFNRYYPLLTGKSMPDPTPHISFYWEECLTNPLATDAYFEAKKRGFEKMRQGIRPTNPLANA